MTTSDIIALLTSYEKTTGGGFCPLAVGNCVYNNTRECPTKSVLNHCGALREHYRQLEEVSTDDRI